ncbi:uncharacterized protein BDV17DRAFT_273286 [Aspergillus undulatus]|uniref:uncharacterized protein n=1 Tax=Aspergillus undulatus TaxID=1810928 RepID=UPI003CCE4495
MSSPPTAGGDRRDRSPHTGSGNTWHPARAWLEEDETGEEEDDDMDFEPDSEDPEDRPDEEYFDPNDDDELYADTLDPRLHLGNIQIEFSMDDDDQTGSGHQAGLPTHGIFSFLLLGLRC